MQRSRTAILILGGTVAGLILGELGLRVISPVPDPYVHFKNSVQNPYIVSQFERNLHFVTETEQGLPGISGRKSFRTNNMGFRGDSLVIPKPENEYRVFLVGGSAAECLYLDDSESIDAVLQRQLNREIGKGRTTKVFNAGKSGDRSFDHVSMIAHRLVHLQPDVIVLFAGVNDLIASLNRVDYLLYPVTGPDPSLSVPPFWKLLATDLQIFRRLHALLKKKEPASILEEIPLKSNHRRLVDFVHSFPESDKKPEVDLTPYATNLRTIIGVARAHGITLVFMTQPSTWDSSEDPGIVSWQWMLYAGGVRYGPASLAKALRSYNELMKTIATENSIPVFDMASALPMTREFFYDDVHFNVHGAQVAGEKFAAFMKNHHLTPD